MKEMLRFEKGLNKLKNRGAVGLSMFVGNTNASIEDIAREASVYLRCMKRSKTKVM